MLIVRSFALATFIVGQGHDPVDYEPVPGLFIFREEARPILKDFRRATFALNALIHEKEDAFEARAREARESRAATK